jgi:hypothetical protein
MFNSKSDSLNYDTQSYFFNELHKIVKPTNKNTSDSSIDYNNTASKEQNVIVHSNPQNNILTIDDNNLCLITKESLHPNHIILSCGHKFNYLPLYKEVVNQKNKSNTGYEITKLDIHQIKCPYCRRITNKLLPYIPYTSVKLIKYVNCPEEHCMNATKCSHTFRRRNKSDSNSDENIDSNNDSGHESTTATTTVIKEHRCDKNAIYYEAEKVLFCQSHYKLYKKKADLAEAKKANANAKKNKSTSDTPYTSDSCVNKCNALLKSGKNSGKKCHNPISTTGSLYCKRHASIVKD